MTAIIYFDNNGDSMFWTGAAWQTEPVDCADIAGAMAAAPGAGEVAQVINYGCTYTERTVRVEAV